MANNKKPVDKPAVSKTFKGTVTSPFKVKNKSYSIGDKYQTLSEDSYNTLIKSKRIK
jgi:hypothetical protein